MTSRMLFVFLSFLIVLSNINSFSIRHDRKCMFKIFIPRGTRVVGVSDFELRSVEFSQYDLTVKNPGITSTS